MISGMLLAAGESKRMGKPKQLMPLGQSTIVEQTINNLLDSTLDELIVVVGNRAEEIIRAIANKPIKIAVNQNYQQGMSSSIIAGLHMINHQAQAVMLILGDQPFIASSTINKLISEFHSHDKGIAIPIYKGRRGHPVIFSMRYKEELLKVKGDIGGKQIIKDHSDDILEVAVDSEGILIDINTMNDYQSHLA